MLSVDRLCSACKIKFWHVSATMIWKNDQKYMNDENMMGTCLEVVPFLFYIGVYLSEMPF